MLTMILSVCFGFCLGLSFWLCAREYAMCFKWMDVRRYGALLQYYGKGVDVCMVS